MLFKSGLFSGSFRSVVALFLGWFLISSGISLLIKADLGVAPYDVLNTALSSRTGLSVGVSTWVSALALLSLAWFIGARPGPGTFLGSFVIGGCIDLLSPLLPSVSTLPLRFLLVVFGFCVLYPGVCLVVLSRLGAGPTEVLMEALVKRGSSLSVARWAIELGCLVVGALLGGSLGFVTVLVTLSAGPLIASLLKPISRISGLGLDRL